VLNYGVRMRPSFRPAAVALVLAAALSASGCTPDASGKPPASTPSATALFASDEEALAAAEEAYRKYQHVSDAILIDGGAYPERLLEVATQAQYEYEKPGYDAALAAGERGEGASNFDSMTIESRFDPPVGDEPVVSVRVCDDYTSVNIFDPAGNSVVSPNRPDRFPRIASFVPSKDSGLLVASIIEWTGESFC